MLRALAECIPNSMIIRQATYREPRPDDDPELMKIYSKDEFEKTDFWVRHKVYAVESADIEVLKNGPNEVGLCVVGINELIKIKDRNVQAEGIQPYTALVRFCESPKDEWAILSERIPSFFEDPTIRLQQSLDLGQRFFWNEDFNKKYIDVSLLRTAHMSEWLKSICTLMDVAPLPSTDFNKVSEKVLDRYKRDIAPKLGPPIV